MSLITRNISNASFINASQDMINTDAPLAANTISTFAIIGIVVGLAVIPAFIYLVVIYVSKDKEREKLIPSNSNTFIHNFFRRVIRRNKIQSISEEDDESSGSANLKAQHSPSKTASCRLQEPVAVKRLESWSSSTLTDKSHCSRDLGIGSSGNPVTHEKCLNKLDSISKNCHIFITSLVNECIQNELKPTNLSFCIHYVAVCLENIEDKCCEYLSDQNLSQACHTYVTIDNIKTALKVQTPLIVALSLPLCENHSTFRMVTLEDDGVANGSADKRQSSVCQICQSIKQIESLFQNGNEPFKTHLCKYRSSVKQENITRDGVLDLGRRTQMCPICKWIQNLETVLKYTNNAYMVAALSPCDYHAGLSNDNNKNTTMDYICNVNSKSFCYICECLESFKTALEVDVSNITESTLPLCKRHAESSHGERSKSICHDDKIGRKLSSSLNANTYDTKESEPDCNKKSIYTPPTNRISFDNIHLSENLNRSLTETVGLELDRLHTEANMRNQNTVSESKSLIVTEESEQDGYTKNNFLSPSDLSSVDNTYLTDKLSGSSSESLRRLEKDRSNTEADIDNEKNVKSLLTRRSVSDAKLNEETSTDNTTFEDTEIPIMEKNDLFYKNCDLASKNTQDGENMAAVSSGAQHQKRMSDISTMAPSIFSNIEGDTDSLTDEECTSLYREYILYMCKTHFDKFIGDITNTAIGDLDTLLHINDKQPMTRCTTKPYVNVDRIPTKTSTNPIIRFFQRGSDRFKRNTLSQIDSSNDINLVDSYILNLHASLASDSKDWAMPPSTEHFEIANLPPNRKSKSKLPPDAAEKLNLLGRKT